MDWLAYPRISNVFRQSYVNGFLDVSQVFIARSDASLNGKLFVSNSTRIVGDVSAGGNLYVNTAIYENGQSLTSKYAAIDSASFTGLTTIPSANITNLTVLSDASFNSRVFINSDLSLNGNLSVNSNVFLHGDTYAVTKSANDNSTYVATTEFVKQQGYSTLTGMETLTNKTISMAGPLTVHTDGINSLNNNDIKLNPNGSGKVHILSDLIVDGSINIIGNFFQTDTNVVVTDQLDISNNGSGPALIVSQYGSNDIATFVQGTNTIMILKDGGYIGINTSAPSRNLDVVGNAAISGDVSLNSNVSIGGTLSLNSLLVDNDISLNSHLSVASDVSMNSRLFVSSDVSLNGNVTLGKTIVVLGDTSLNSHLSVISDVSLNSRLFVLSDVSLNGNVRFGKSIVINGDASLNSRLSIAGDASLNSRLFVSSDVSLNGDVRLGKSIVVLGDASLNSRLSISGDASLNSRLFVSSDVSLNGNVRLGKSIVVLGDASLNSRLSVAGDASLNSRLFVSSDVSLNSRLSVGGDSTLNGRLIVSPSTGIAKVSVVDNTSNRQPSIEFLRGTTYFDNAPVYSNWRMLVSGGVTDGSMNNVPPAGCLTFFTNGGGFIGNPLTLTFNNYVGINTINPAYPLDVSGLARFNSDVSLNSNLYVLGKSVIQNDVSLNSHLSVTSDVSLNSRLFVSSDVSLNGDVRLGKTFVVLGDASLNSHLSVTSDVSLNSRLFVSSDVSLNGNVRLSKTLVVLGDASLNSRLSIAGDASLNSRLFVSSDVSLNGNVRLGKTLVVLGDASLNSRLSISGDASLNSRLFVSSDVSLNGNLSVKNDVSMNSNLQVFGTIYQGTDLVATQPYVTNALTQYAQLSGADFTGPITVDTVGGIKTSSNGNLNLAPNGSGIVHIKSDLIVDGSVNFMGEFIQTNTNVTVTEQLNIANDGTGPALIVSQVGANDVATFIQGSDTIMVIKDGGLIGINKTNPTQTLDVSGSLYIEGKATFNDITYFIKDVSMSANLNAPTPSTIENSTKVATTAYVKQQGYATLTGTETLTNKTINATGLITAQSGLFVSNESIFDGHIYVSVDASFNGNTNLNTAIIGASNDTHKMTLNSNKINVYDGVSTFYDVSTSKLVYIKDLSENVQTRLTDLINRTLAIDTNGSDANTKIQVDTVNNQILVSSDIIPATNSINLGSAAHPFKSIYVNTNTLHFTDTIVTAAISYNSGTSSLDLTTNGITTTHVNSYNGNVGIGKLSTDAVARLDVSGTAIISGLTVIKSDLSLNSRLSVAGDVSLNSNLTVSKNVGIGISKPLAPLHINGGMITTSDGFPRKLYSYNSGSVSLSSSSSAFVLTFSNTSTYFANITAMLVDQTNPNNISTLIFDIQGGSGDGSTPTTNIGIGSFTRKGPYNNSIYAWSTNYNTTKSTVSIYTANSSTRNFVANFYIELFSGPNNNTSSLLSISNGANVHSFDY